MIKNVTIGYLREEKKTGIIQNGKTVYKLKRSNTFNRICIIDDNKAINVNNLYEQYEVIKRNDVGQIIQTTDENTQYALECNEIPKIKQLKYKIFEKRYKKLNR